jgi:hypothetical protein
MRALEWVLLRGELTLAAPLWVGGRYHGVATAGDAAVVQVAVYRRW